MNSCPDFFQHPPQFNPCQSGMRRPERFKAEHGSDPSFDKPVILLDDIVKVFTLANLDAFVFVNTATGFCHGQR